MNKFERGLDPKDAMNTGNASLREQKKREKEHLTFIYWRLVHMYAEKENIDYMIKFKSIIDKL